MHLPLMLEWMVGMPTGDAIGMLVLVLIGLVLNMRIL